MSSLAAIGLFNYVVNPEGIFQTRVVPPILWGVRPEKVELLRRAQPAPRALILGSSRVANLSATAVQRATGLPTFNFGVGDAKTEDYYAILRYAVEEVHLRPKLLVIGIDVEAFHDHEAAHYYMRQPTPLGKFLIQGKKHFWWWGDFTRLFTLSDSELSLDSCYHAWLAKTPPRAHNDADGQTHYDTLERKRASGQLDLQQEIQATIASYAPRYDDYTGLSRQRIDYFVSALRYANDLGAQVTVFLTPTHPDVGKGLRIHGYELRKQEVTALMEQLCAQFNAQWYDFSTTQRFGGDDHNFYDGLHYNEMLSAEILPRMFPMSAHAIQ